MSCWSGWLAQPGTMTHGSLSCTVLSPSFTDRAGFCTLLWQHTGLSAQGSCYPARGRTNYSLPGKTASPHSQRVLCSAVLFYSPMAALSGQQRQPLLLGKILPHKMKYLKPIYIPIPNIRDDSPGKSFGFQITCAQPSKTPFLAS